MFQIVLRALITIPHATIEDTTEEEILPSKTKLVDQIVLFVHAAPTAADIAQR